MDLSFEIAVVIGVTLVLITGFLSVLFINKFSKQRGYCNKIIDNSVNIVLVSNGLELIKANTTFFHYFDKFDNIKDFSKKHACICEFFEEEDGYLSPLTDGEPWIEYLVTYQTLKHKVKIKIADRIYYFLVSASLIDVKSRVYAIIFSDITEQEITKKELVSLSVIDEMTNVGNRKLYDKAITEQIVLAQRYVHPFSLVILDIDFFKKVNDELGHAGGDQVLKLYSKLISFNLRQSDIFARIGGEEFAIILPHTTKDKAYILAQKLREMVENYRGEGLIPITISLGVVQYIKGDDESSIFKRADTALYKAKDSGRNRVVLG